MLPDVHIKARLHPYSIQFAMSSDVCMTLASDDVNDGHVISSHPDVTIPFARNYVFQTSVTGCRKHNPSASCMEVTFVGLVSHFLPWEET